MGSTWRLVAVVALVGCGSGTSHTEESSSVPAPRRLRATVIDTLPHSTAAFTQGLVFDGPDRLLESVGTYGGSEVRELDPLSGDARVTRALPDDVFAEGLGIHDDRLVQLTWREGRALIWELTSLESIGEFSYRGEGWGLDFDAKGDRWVQSDGSDRLWFRDPDTFAPAGELVVRRGGRPISRLNELEVVGDVVWANIWQSDSLVRIDLGTGMVTAEVDLSALGPEPPASPDDVLNGIAHRPGDDPNHLWVTGKRWPLLYQIVLSG